MRSRRHHHAGCVRAAAIACLLVVAARAISSQPDEVAELRFTRVHVPRDALGDVPLGDQRYVPLPRPAFEAALGRAARRGTSPELPELTRADAARYEARVGTTDRLEGRVSFDVGAAAALRPDLSLGRLAVSRCTASTDAGVGDAVVFCRTDGSRAVVPAGEGEYVAEWIGPAPTATMDGPRYVLPLLPAVRSSIRLELPAGRRPLLVRHSLPPKRSGTAWVIETAFRDVIEFLVIDESRPSPGLSVWSAIDVSGREVSLETSLAPLALWGEQEVVVEKDPALVVTAAFLGDADAHAVAWFEAGDGRSITCRLPPPACGGTTPVVIRAVGPLPDGAVQPLPMLRPRSKDWTAGGTLLRVDPALAVASLQVEGCLAVTAEAASAWPLPTSSRPGARGGLAVQVQPAQVFLEHQAAATEIRLTVVPRAPRLDVDRVTVVDFAPGVVVGVATCNVGVERGEAFDLEGFVAPGWFIDAVDIVGWSQPLAWSDPGPTSDVRPADPLDWKVVRGERGDVLRVGLASAITPDRRLRLRISGHRAGAAAGAVFSSGEIDMVRIPAAAAGPAAVGFKASAEQAVEIDGATAGALSPRLAALVDDAAVRFWAPAGAGAEAWQVRLVERRPPLDVQARVRLTARDDRMSQSFTFECRPDTSDLDGLTVRFSEVMDDQLEWSLLAPATGGIVARRLEAADEAWRIEFTPPIREPVTIRASRTVPFSAAVPVPLAWVEGAARQVGEVIVRDAGRRRPRLVNRRLAELPARSRDGDRWPTLIGAFSFAGEPDPGLPPAAELMPGAHDDDARAWAWRETVSCWCHASGRTEFETVFDIENQGRPGLVVGLPPGRQLQGVEIDGAPVAVMPRDDVAAVPIDLPAGRSALRLVVRTVAANGAAGAWWRVEPAGVAVDLPVLDRLYRIHLPPDLEIATSAADWRRVGADDRGVLERLFGLEAAPAAGPTFAAIGVPPGPPGDVFREQDFVPTAGRGDIVVVQRRWIGVAAVVVGIVAAAGVLLVARVRPWLMPVICVAAGVAALWSPAPADVVVRAGWWTAALTTGLLVGRRLARWGATTAGLVLALTLGGVAAGRAAEPVSVFVMPGDDGETALVPEPLYRVLVRAAADDATSVHVLSTEVVVPAAGPERRGGERWRVSIDLDAAAAGILPLGPVEAAVGWVAASLRLDGRPAVLAGGPVRNDVVVPTAGRHVLEAEIAPRVEVFGETETLTVSLPPAPTAVLRLDDPDGVADGRVRCEAAVRGEGFAEACTTWSTAAGQPVADVAGADRVRIVRSRVPGVTLASAAPAVESRNAVSWELDACRLAASFVVEPGRAIAAPCIVHADTGLELVGPTDPGLDVTPLSGNRWAVRATAPVAGPWRFELMFRMPLADPVGRFHVPGAWIEDAAVDVRTTRLVSAGDLAVQIEAPAPFAPVPGDDSAWRLEVRPQGGVPVGIASVAASRIRITAERRRQEVRGTQDARIRFAPERTRISLVARFDATSAPLVTLPLELPPECVIDTVTLLDDDLQPPESTVRGPIEAQWRRDAPERGVLTVQRPRAGRFRLEVMAHMPGPPAATGRLPVVRVALPAAPAIISWNDSSGDEGAEQSRELRSDEQAPPYALQARVAAEPPTAAAPEQNSPPEKRATEEPRVELADVEVSFEGRGRAWGRARFDVVARQRLLRLVLPGGMRLFDVLVDGQPTATVTPAVVGAPAHAGERWDIRLHDTSWPRCIEVVYAGTVGGAADDGPVEITAPTLLGLPCGRRLWTLHAPRDAVVHVAEPGRVATEAEVRTERAAALERIGASFDRAIAAAMPADRERLADEFSARTPLLEGDSGVGDPFARRGGIVHVIGTAGDAPLTIRIARRRDPTLLARAWATTVILAVGSALWLGMRRRLSH